MAHANSRLFAPLCIGTMDLQNRLVMAPLTRLRAADPEHVPLLPMVKTYYEQRAAVSGTLLLTEATYVSPQATGNANAPGIWSAAQIAAWKEVTTAVHNKGCFLVCQLWHQGRAAGAEDLERKGLDVVSSSSRGLEGNPKPRPLTEQEIERTIDEYRQAARNAIEAGFDGVEIHGANGYLVDQFTQATCNDRTDQWGGTVENRSRFALAVTQACVDAIGKQRVGIRLSPWSRFQDMCGPDEAAVREQFTHLVAGLREFDLAFLELVESRISGGKDNVDATETLDFAIDTWNHTGESKPLLVAGGYLPDSALQLVDEERAKEDICVVFGRYWIRNPDLVWRIKEGISLEKYDRDTFYKIKSPDGYTDWEYHPDFPVTKA